MADAKSPAVRHLFGGSGTAAQAQGSPTGVPSKPITETPNRPKCPGTASVLFKPLIEADSGDKLGKIATYNITCMDFYKLWSCEELRLADYDQGRRYGSSWATTSSLDTTSATAASSGGANTSTGFKPATTNTMSPFVTHTSGRTAFGGKTEPTTPPKLFGPMTGISPFAATKPASTGTKNSSEGSVTTSRSEAATKPFGFHITSTLSLPPSRQALTSRILPKSA